MRNIKRNCYQIKAKCVLINDESELIWIKVWNFSMDILMR